MHTPTAINRPAAQSARRRRATQAVRARDCGRRGRELSIANSGVAAPLRSNALRFLALGAILVCLGGVGDMAYHLLPVTFATSLEPLVGVEGIRAHLVTLAGMAVMLGAVISRGLRR